MFCIFNIQQNYYLWRNLPPLFSLYWYLYLRDSPEELIPTTVTYTLTVATSGGGSVSSAGGTYDKGAAVVITAIAAAGYTFSGW